MDFILNISAINFSVSSLYFSTKIFKIVLNIKTLCILLFANSIFSQDYIKNDSIKFDQTTYIYTHISFGMSNSTKYFKVMTCKKSECSKVEKAIVDCAKNSKLEYSEFYLLLIPDEKLKNINDKTILLHFIHKIDIDRMSLNLSTALIKSNYDYKNNIFEYLLNEPETTFNEYKLNITPKEVCSFLKK